MKISGKAFEFLLFLSATPDEEFSGYELGRKLQISSGTLYPVLVKLETAGLVSCRWEDGDPRELGRPMRRYYKISGLGISAVSEKIRIVYPRFQPIGKLGGFVKSFSG